MRGGCESQTAATEGPKLYHEFTPNLLTGACRANEHDEEAEAEKEPTKELQRYMVTRVTSGKTVSMERRKRKHYRHETDQRLAYFTLMSSETTHRRNRRLIWAIAG